MLLSLAAADEWVAVAAAEGRSAQPNKEKTIIKIKRNALFVTVTSRKNLFNAQERGANLSRPRRTPVFYHAKAILLQYISPKHIPFYRRQTLFYTTSPPIQAA